MGEDGVSLFPSTILPQTNDPKEIQRGMLDLLEKINRVGSSIPGSSGGGIKSVSVDYAFAPNDGIFDLFVTTGASTITVTLDKSSRNLGRLVRIWKADSGAGEVKIAGFNSGGTAETISGYANVYVGLRYQHADIYQDGTTNFNVGQYIQPVAGEPSAGTFHALARSPGGYDVNANTTATTGTPATLDLTSVIPVGAKAVQLVIWTNYSGTAEVNSNYSIAWNYDDGAFSIYRDLQNGVMAQYSYKVATAGARNTTGSNEGVSTIGTSRKLYFGAQNSGAATSIMIKGYYI